jgi:hypothetical protein
MYFCGGKRPHCGEIDSNALRERSAAKTTAVRERTQCGETPSYMYMYRMHAIF